MIFCVIRYGRHNGLPLRVMHTLKQRYPAGEVSASLDQRKYVPDKDYFINMLHI